MSHIFFFTVIKNRDTHLPKYTSMYYFPLYTDNKLELFVDKGGDTLATGKRIAPHEAFELHEILTFKNVCATKSATMAGLVKDGDLKAILQQDFTVSQGHIKELQGLIQTSDFAASGMAGTVSTTGSVGAAGAIGTTNH